ncbi:hypothetical protein FCV25MIE_19564 [Fagus crenata]
MARSDGEQLSSTSGARGVPTADNSKPPVPQVVMESSDAGSGTEIVGPTFRDVEESIKPTAVEEEIIPVDTGGEVFPESHRMDFQILSKMDKDGASGGKKGEGRGYIRGDKDNILGNLGVPNEGRELHDDKHVGMDTKVGPKSNEIQVASGVAHVSLPRPSKWKKHARVHGSVDVRVVDPLLAINEHGKRVFVGDACSGADESTEPILKRRQLSGVSSVG